MIKGVLFDMDGVLVDSEAFICKAAIEMFRELGIIAKPADFQPFVGMGENRFIGGVAEKYNLKLDIIEAKARTYQIYERITRNQLDPLPGAIEFVTFCHNKGLKLALATSADSIKMEVNLKEIGLSKDDFNSTVNGLEVKRKKPFPDIYIKAAENLGLKTEECLVVEDAVSGVRAAKAAGCKCLAIVNSFDKSALMEADWICDSLLKVPDEALNW
jgi:HAD superfamily hydrolase (TIGR01509 family)